MHTSIIRFPVVAFLTFATPAVAWGQDHRSDTTEVRRDRLRAAFSADTNLVKPSWFPFQMVKNVVVIGFRTEASPTQRFDAVASIHGTIIDTTSWLWIVHVPSYPDACGVYRATERLGQLSWVHVAMPYFFIPFIPLEHDNARSEVAKPTVQTRAPNPVQACPPADSVLR